MNTSPGGAKEFNPLAALHTYCENGLAAAIGPYYVVRGSGISRSRQILRTKNSLISRCLGTDDALRLERFTYTVWLPPSRRNSNRSQKWTFSGPALRDKGIPACRDAEKGPYKSGLY